MKKKEEGIAHNDRQSMDCPEAIRQYALVVIARTRYEWLSRAAAHDPVVVHARFAEPVFRRSRDAMNSSAGRARSIRARGRRRACGQFAT